MRVIFSTLRTKRQSCKTTFIISDSVNWEQHIILKASQKQPLYRKSTKATLHSYLRKQLKIPILSAGLEVGSHKIQQSWARPNSSPCNSADMLRFDRSYAHDIRWHSTRPAFDISVSQKSLANTRTS